LRIWDAADGKEVARLDARSAQRENSVGGDIVDVAVFRFADRLHLVVASLGNNTVRVWELGDILARPMDPPAPYKSLRVRERGLTSLAVTPDGTRVVVGLADRENSVWVWDYLRDTVVARLVGHEERVNTVAVFPDGRRILTGSDDKTAKTWVLSPDN
jgi:WD40 repeat protein